MSKKFCIVVFVMFGFIMMPGIVYACGTKSEKACCKKEASSKAEKSGCCNKEHSSKENGCNGACKNISCAGSTVHLGLISVFYPDLNTVNFIFSSEKENYYYSEIFISSDFRSIWLPPKIG